MNPPVVTPKPPSTLLKSLSFTIKSGAGEPVHSYEINFPPPPIIILLLIFVFFSCARTVYVILHIKRKANVSIIEETQKYIINIDKFQMPHRAVE